METANVLGLLPELLIEEIKLHIEQIELHIEQIEIIIKEEYKT